jgi:hypothetical protein
MLLLLLWLLLRLHLLRLRLLRLKLCCLLASRMGKCIHQDRSTSGQHQVERHTGGMLRWPVAAQPVPHG